MGGRKRSSVTFFAVYPYTVLQGQARMKEQMGGVDKPTTLSRQHDLDTFVSPRRPKQREIDVEEFDGVNAAREGKKEAQVE